MANPDPLLSVRDLSVDFGALRAVRGVSFDLARGQTLALVGESGSGKSSVALAALGLLPASAKVNGSVRFDSREVVGAPARDLMQIRGRRAGMIFQEPLSALNPLHTVEKQISETVRIHEGLSGPALRARVGELFDMVELPALKARLRARPHELSGGQRQRVMIAMALSCRPDILIADEPTTALDMTVQAQILSLLRDLQVRLNMAMLLISHALPVVERMAAQTCVMQRGRIVEAGPTAKILSAPRHPYTQKLLAARNLGRTIEIKNASQAPVLEAKSIVVRFPARKTLLGRVKAWTTAVDGVDLTVRAGQTLGVVGESGSGKTTLGLALLRMQRAGGEIAFAGRALPPRPEKAFRAGAQIVFQDPYGALSPRMSVGDIVGEGLRVHARGLSAAQRRARVAQALEEVRMEPGAADRYPHEFSGGQRQRIAIARALVVEPRLIVLDEPTSALDLSVQAIVLDLLRDLQARRGLAYIFISHDLAVVRAMAHEVAVMRGGRVVERGPATQVFGAPRDPYTQKLLASAA